MVNDQREMYWMILEVCCLILPTNWMPCFTWREIHSSIEMLMSKVSFVGRFNPTHTHEYISMYYGNDVIGDWTVPLKLLLFFLTFIESKPKQLILTQHCIFNFVILILQYNLIDTKNNQILFLRQQLLCITISYYYSNFTSCSFCY